MTDRDHWKLGGLVRSCRLKRNWSFRRCGADACDTVESGDESLIEFRRDGSAARRWWRNPDGSEGTSINEYNDAGCLLTSRSEISGAVTGHRHEYDAAGRLLRIVTRTPDGLEQIRETWEYDAHGRKKKTVHVEVASQSGNMFYAVEGTDAAYSAPGAASVTIAYNDDAHPAEMLFHDPAGHLLSRVEFVYDPAGHLLEEAQTRSPETFSELTSQMNELQAETVRKFFGASEPMRRFHRYDDRGRRIETRSAIGILGSDRKTMAYNEQGDLIQEISEHESREYGMDDTGNLSDGPTKETATRSEARIEYDYDRHGNWTSKTVRHRVGDADFTVSSSETRTLSYYDQSPES